MSWKIKKRCGALNRGEKVFGRLEGNRYVSWNKEAEKKVGNWVLGRVQWEKISLFHQWGKGLGGRTVKREKSRTKCR